METKPIPWLGAMLLVMLTACDTSRTAVSIASAAAQSNALANPGFEEGTPGEVPAGWFVPPLVKQAGYAVKLMESGAKSGRRCALIYRARETSLANGFGNLMQSFDAAPYRGKTVRFRMAVRAESGGQAQLWLRVDRAAGKMGFFDNMGDRPITASEWRVYEIVARVDSDAASVNLGAMLIGGGKAWLDDASFTVLGEMATEPPRALTDRGMENVIAFARLFGYVRHFYPGDEAAKTDWDAFAVAGVRAVEGMKDADELAGKLQEMLRPVAPAAQVFPTARKPPLNAELGPPPGTKSLQVVAWRHTGFGGGTIKGNVYSSERVRQDAPGGKVPEGFGDPHAPFEADLGGGVSCSIPLALFVDARGSLPRAAGKAPDVTAAGPFTADDRATRLSDVVIAWNVFQHFYPYFDITPTDWPRVLRETLSSAASDKDAAAFLNTLRRMVAELHDGHGHANGPGDSGFAMPPVLCDWVESKLAVLSVAPKAFGAGGLKPGDVLTKLDGRPIAEVAAEQERLISGATPQWIRFRLASELLRGAPGSEITLEAQRGAEPPFTVRLKRGGLLREARPDKVAEVRPGVFYVDIDRVTDEDFNRALPQLAKVKGVIFDFRGYPSHLLFTGATFLTHLTDKPLMSPQWHIPIVTRPDRQGLAFTSSRWPPMQPTPPRLTGRVAFLTDGRAISAAESMMGIVEYYKLGEIVGEPTAGTNGNVNPFRLPGGYTLVWTGMRVLKHDGSRHHGVGIRPTIPVSRTLKGVAAGRDEILEKAIEVVSR